MPRGMPDVLQDNLIGYEWLRSPVDVDEGEHLMLNGVPLTGAWWVVTHVDSYSCPVGELLQTPLPEPVV